MTLVIDPAQALGQPPGLPICRLVDRTQTSRSEPQGARPPHIVLGVILFGGTALAILHDWLGIGGAGLDDFVGGPLYDSVVLAAGVACLFRARAVPRERLGWTLMGIAILFWGAGEVYWTLFILDNPSPPYPSPADALYLAFYPLACAGLAGLVRARAQELDWRRWTDAAIAALGTAALGTAFIFDFVADHTSGSGLQVATTLAYPLGDIVMLSAIVGVIALSGWQPGRTWSLLLAGLTAQAVADIAYTLQSTDGVVPGGAWIDPIYLISAVFLGSVLWLPRAAPIRPVRSEDGWRELMVPGLFAAVMIGLFTMRYFSAGSGLAGALWGLTMVAVVVRLALSVKENRSLLEQARTDPLTGLGNRGAMQVDLDAACESADETSPATLLLFDLNGFKRYNDSFGHPAGDELLLHLGEALRKAAAPIGTVYRIGGDEFCLLAPASGDELEALTRKTAQALTASRHSVEVGSSWGAATIPTEVSTPREALQLADVRMYAQKESRRVASTQPRLNETVKVSAWPKTTQDA
jgi:diguanylate cyclase (GGDEF)-like protein